MLSADGAEEEQRRRDAVSRKATSVARILFRGSEFESPAKKKDVETESVEVRSKTGGGRGGSIWSSASAAACSRGEQAPPAESTVTTAVVVAAATATTTTIRDAIQ